MKNHTKSKTNSTINTKINLKVTGFSAQNILSTEEIVQVLDLLPSSHLTNLDEINYDPYRVIPKVMANAYQANHTKVKGCYLQKLKLIALFEISDKVSALHLLLHEIGHHVYYRVIDSRIKKVWVTETHLSDKHITHYSRTNASEDFAECYASYIITPSQFRLCRKKYSFFENFIFT